MAKKKTSRSEPATQHDLDAWGGELTRRVDGVELRVEKIEKTMATKDDLRQLKEEIFHHFDAAVEEIHHDLAGANKDEISFIANKQDDHEHRLRRIEKRIFVA